MVRDKPMTTRVSQEAYKVLLQKCADRGCSTYEYLRQLVHEDTGLAEENGSAAPAPVVPKLNQTELIAEDEPVREGIKITRG